MVMDVVVATAFSVLSPSSPYLSPFILIELVPLSPTLLFLLRKIEGTLSILLNLMEETLPGVPLLTTASSSKLVNAVSSSIDLERSRVLFLWLLLIVAEISPQPDLRRSCALADRCTALPSTMYL